MTKKDAYPLPSIEIIVVRLPKVNIFMELDLKDAYWQIPMGDASKRLTAFTVPARPLSLPICCNAVYCMQCTANDV